MNVQELSEQLSITPRRVQQLAKANILPKVGRGDYPFDDCKRQYEKYLENSYKPESFTVSLRELAICLSLEMNQVERLIERGIIRCSETSPRRFNLDTAIKNYFSHIRQMARVHRARERNEKTQQVLGISDRGPGR